MRAADIVLGTEYCVTGPLAYGTEPSVTSPDRVRFLDTTPGWGWVETRILEDTKWGRRLVTHKGTTIPANPNKTEFRHVAAYPDRRNLRLDLQSKPVGHIVRTFTPEKGFYLAERWDGTRQQWDQTLAQPAAIHRTWAEYEARIAAQFKRTIQSKVDGAPVRFETEMRSALREAAYAGHDLAFIDAWIRQQYPDVQTVVALNREKAGV